MKPEKITEKGLEKTKWWWRSRKKIDPILGNKLAFHYELVRRLYREENFLPYLSLKAPHLELIYRLSDDSLQAMPSRSASDSQLQNETGWTHDFHLQWNLRLSDHALHNAFQELIDRERANQKIPVPRQNVGKRNRPFSWRWPELMDIADFKIRVLNDAERKSLSMARERANQKRLLFETALEELWEARATMTKSWLTQQWDLYAFGGLDKGGLKSLWPRE